MAAIDFPANPTVGQRFTAGGIIWTWDGLKWTLSGSGSISINDAPPTNPLDGALWWDTASGNLFIYYDDGTSAQWVVAVNLNTAGPVGPEGPQGDPGPTGPVGPMGPAPLQAIGDNRIINGDMRIGQRGPTGDAAGYTVDRWQWQGTPDIGHWSQGNAASQAPIVGSSAYLAFSTDTAAAMNPDDYLAFAQYIEADMVTDFAWGTPDAQPVTLSFWAASNVAGMFSGSIRNQTTGTDASPSYPFAFDLPADVWTWFAITIPGDTNAASNWILTGNEAGLAVFFCMGEGGTYSAPAGAWVDQNCVGATGTTNIGDTVGDYFAVTGVKLEIGDVATPYPRQSMAKSLADCQRYYQVLTSVILCAGYSANVMYGSYVFPTTMRASPTVTPSGVAYANASSFLMNNVSPDNVTMSMVMLAAGFGYAQGSIILDAEL